MTKPGFEEGPQMIVLTEKGKAAIERLRRKARAKSAKQRRARKPAIDQTGRS